MASLCASLRAQLVDIAQKLLTASTAGAQTEDASSIKDELVEIVTVLALFQSDVRQVLEQAITDLETSNTTSIMSALSLVARASASLELAPAPALNAPAQAPPPPLPPPPPTRTFPLPTELIAYILDLVHPLADFKQRQASFMSSALVSRAFYRAAKLHLDKELAITNARQFKALAVKLEVHPSTLSSVGNLILDFNFADLRSSLTWDLRGRDWLAPFAATIFEKMGTTRSLVLGSTFVESWELDRDIDKDDGSFVDSLMVEAGVNLPELLPVLQLLKILPHPTFGHSFLALQRAFMQHWQSVERIEFIGDPSAQSFTLGSVHGELACSSLRDLLAPHTIITPSQLLWLCSGPSSIRRLECTLGIIQFDGDIDKHVKDITTIFALLAPTLQHFHLQLEISGIAPHLSDHVLDLISTLPHLTSLGLGGNIVYPHWSGPTATTIEALASLPLTSLSLFSSDYDLFEQPRVVSDDFTSVLGRKEEDTRGNFAKLRRLLIEYDDDTMKNIPAELVKICRERGIELSLCKVAED